MEVSISLCLFTQPTNIDIFHFFHLIFPINQSIEATADVYFRVVFWTNWMQGHWYASFRDYMVQVMVKDEETAPPDED